MSFTIAEKLQIAMLCDLAKPQKDRELDFEFIWSAAMNGDLWALDRKYSGLRLNVPTPDDVSLVSDVLDMWDRLEVDFAALPPAEQSRVQAESYHDGAPRFIGFDGNNETELMHIARLLVNHLGYFEVFKGRDMNSHSPSIETYKRMLSEWRPMWDVKTNSGNYKFAADEIIIILRERIHPEHRKIQPGGGWTFDRPKPR